MTTGRLAPALLAVGLLLWGCAGTGQNGAGLVPPPPRLPVSAQTAASPEIEAAAAVVRDAAGPGDFNRLLAAMRFVGEHLAYDALGSRDQFRRDAATLFRERTLDGCSDFALAQLALFRALGYPSRLVLTMNAKWLARYRENPLALPNGHSFIEVWVDGRWRLADPTAFVIYDGYDPAAPYLPGNEIFLTRANDFPEAGLTSVEAANARLRAAADAFTGTYVKPGLAERWKVDFNYPAAFANLGQVFLDRGRPALGLRLLRKALVLRPDYPPALIALGRYSLETGQPAHAVGYFRRALTADPANAQAAEGLARAQTAAAAQGGPG